MDNAVLDPEGYSPADVVARLQRTIRMGIEGINYTVVQREKNEKLFRDYCIDSRKRKDILASLTVEDYVRWDYSDKKEFSSIVHFFEKKVKLIPRYIEDAEAVTVDLYIKITWNSAANNFLVIISFHEKEY